MRSKIAPLLAAIGVCVFALVVAGCGDSNSSSDESTESAFPAAAKRNAEFEERPTSVGIKTPVGKPIPEGKTIDFIECGVPACAVEGELFEEAMSNLGWKLNSIKAGTTPEEIKAAYQQAINNKPDAVLASGYPTVLFKPELAQLKKLDIPVVQFFIQEEASPGVTAVIGGPTTSEFQGKMMADYVLAHSDDKSMEVGVVNANGFETVTATADKVEEVVAEECPSCATKRLDAPVTSIGGDLPQRISSFLTANPDMKWMTVGYNDMVVGLPTALKGAGVEGVNLTTININPSVAPYLKKGEYLQSTSGTSFPEVYWRGVDMLARLFAGVPYDEDLDDSTLPYWTITADTVPTTTEEFPVVEDYEEQFKKLWGVE
jgi:ribose transport system substrate-binding protein